MEKAIKLLSILTIILSTYCVADAKWKPVSVNAQFINLSEINSYNGTLYAISKNNTNWNSYENSIDQIYVSQDNGANWSPLGSIEDESKLAGLRVDRILITAQGFLVVSGFSKYLNDENGYPRVTVYISQDSGKTFKNVYKSTPYFCCERTTHIEQDSQGTLVLGYSQNHEISLVKSIDGGKKWSQFAAIPQSFSTNPNGDWFGFLSSNQLFVTVESGDIYSSNLSTTQLATNAIEGSFAENLYAFPSSESAGVLLQTGKFYGIGGFVRISYDSGKSWSVTNLSEMVPPKEGLGIQKVFDFGRRILSSADTSKTVNSFGFSVMTWPNKDFGKYQNDVSFCENASKGFDCINFGNQGIKYIIGANKGKNNKDYLYLFNEKDNLAGILTVLERQ